MITKEKIIDQITVDQNDTILVREVTHIIEDGVILSSSFHRTSYEKNSTDINSLPERVKKIADAIWF